MRVMSGLINRVMIRMRAALAALPPLAVALAMGCSAEPNGATANLPPSPFVLSRPLHSISAARSSTSTLSQIDAPDSTVVYVSLPSGAIPDGHSAVIRNPRLDVSVATGVTDGGFDPVPLAAEVGDSITVAVQVGVSGGQVSYSNIVLERARPIVVRTNPPNHKRDVPLNALVEIVFSEPMDSASLSAAVRLQAGGSSLSGRVSIAPNSGAILRVTFVPAAQLVPLTKYVLQVDVSAHDQQGNTLAAPASTDFTTGSLPVDTIAPVVSVLSPKAGDTLALGYESFTVQISGSHGFASFEIRLVNQQSGQQHYTDIFTDGTSGSQPFHENGIYGPGSDALIPGTYEVQVSATDLAGNRGTTAPFSLTLAAPDTAPRIIVQSFSVVESEKTPIPGTGSTPRNSTFQMRRDTPDSKSSASKCCPFLAYRRHGRASGPDPSPSRLVSPQRCSTISTETLRSPSRTVMARAQLEAKRACG